LALSDFRLLWGSKSLDLNPGATVFGRGDDCELCTDDPRVSRQHARFIVAGKSVIIEDLGSRNGVSVNGARIAQSQSLTPGDRIRIGEQELTLLRGSSAEFAVEPQAPTQRFDGLAVISELTEKAIVLGRLDEAERLVEAPLNQLIEDLSEKRDVPAALISRASVLVMRLVVVTTKRVWVDRLVNLYRQLARPWPADIIDEMYGVARRVSGVDRAALKAYVIAMRNAQLGPADRFLAGRIEGLERQFPIP
jgi:hypothetical protein